MIVILLSFYLKIILSIFLILELIENRELFATIN